MSTLVRAATRCTAALRTFGQIAEGAGARVARRWRLQRAQHHLHARLDVRLGVQPREIHHAARVLAETLVLDRLDTARESKRVDDEHKLPTGGGGGADGRGGAMVCVCS